MSLPPIRLLNLDRSTARLRRFRERNAHLGDVTRTTATDGAALDRSELERAGYIAADFACGAGSLGTALSHIRLWEESVRLNQALTVFEDDVVVAHSFQQSAARALSQLPPTWDIIKWGYPLNLTAWVELGLATTRLESSWRLIRHDAESLTAFQTTEAPAAPVRMLFSFGLFAYSISPKGARLALEHCLPLTNRVMRLPDDSEVEVRGIDAGLADAFARMEAFLCLPCLVEHADDGASDRMAIDEAISRPS